MTFIDSILNISPCKRSGDGDGGRGGAGESKARGRSVTFAKAAEFPRVRFQSAGIRPAATHSVSQFRTAEKSRLKLSGIKFLTPSDNGVIPPTGRACFPLLYFS